MVGSLRYLYNIIPDICYAVGMVSMFMNKPNWSYYQVVVRILRYIKGTMRYGVLFPYSVKSDSELICYLDSDSCGDRVDKISTSGYFFKCLRDSISWRSKKQPMVTLLTCEVEYIVGALSACQVVWIMNLLQVLKIQVSKLVRMLIDNKSTIGLVKNLVLHGRSKHIDAKFHFFAQVGSKWSAWSCSIYNS